MTSRFTGPRSSPCSGLKASTLLADSDAGDAGIRLEGRVWTRRVPMIGVNEEVRCGVMRHGVVLTPKNISAVWVEQDRYCQVGRSKQPGGWGTCMTREASGCFDVRGDYSMAQEINGRVRGDTVSQLSHRAEISNNSAC